MPLRWLISALLMTVGYFGLNPATASAQGGGRITQITWTYTDHLGAPKKGTKPFPDPPASQSVTLPAELADTALTFEGVCGPPGISFRIDFFEHDPTKPVGSQDTLLFTEYPALTLVTSTYKFSFSRPAGTFKAGRVYRTKTYASLGLVDMRPYEQGFNFTNVVVPR